MNISIKIKRVYEKYDVNDGFRILVDRLWPRGLSKEEAKIDLWMKEIAPSDNLRKWFAHDPKKWEEFMKKYEEELRKNENLNKLIKIIQEKKNVTLLYSAKNKEHNNAVVLKNVLESIIKGSS
jgi:uncharacterized protein YeaO (DUF488 family)